MKRMLIIILTAVLIAGCRTNPKEQVMSTEDIARVGVENLRITVVYDNRVYQEGLEPAWGFACLIEGIDTTILFDTGGDGEILMRNMAKLGIEPKQVDVVVLSHEHWDHIGGLGEFLAHNPKVTVYVLESFPAHIKEQVNNASADLMEITSPVEICKGVYSTGPMGMAIKEQSLLIPTDKGVIVITGCAHPGVVKIVKKAKELTGQEILLVMGGFHLLGHNDAQLKKIIAEFKELGVKYAAPCHCTGDKAIGLFRDEYGKQFIEIGAGKVIAANHLTTAL